MTTKKIEQCLALAFNNSSKEEATTAFGQAFAYAKRLGVQLCDFRGKSDRSATAGCDADREQELVEKYNTLLTRSRQLKESLAIQLELNDLKDSQLAILRKEVAELYRQNGAADEAAKLRAEIRELNRSIEIKDAALMGYRGRCEDLERKRSDELAEANATIIALQGQLLKMHMQGN